MKIELKQPFRGLNSPLVWDDIPMLAVLTGENGCGKTHLLQALFQSVATGGPKVVVTDQTDINESNAVFLRLPPRFDKATASVDAGTVVGNLRGLAEPLRQGSIVNHGNQTTYLRECIKNSTGKEAMELSVEEIMRVMPLNSTFPRYPDQTNMFVHAVDAIAHACKRYRIKELEETARLGRINGYSAETLRRTLGEPPWEALNRLLQTAGSPARLEPPAESLEAPYTPTFYGSRRVPLNELSMGEQTLVGIGIVVYVLRDFGLSLKLLLADELDAHLHSSVIPGFLRALDEFVAQEFKCRVIMTTHRPDTLACAPQGSVFLMRRTAEEQAIQPSSAAQAISSLSQAALLVQENSVAILVESDDDARYYRDVFETLVRIDMWPSPVRLDFRGVDKAVVGREAGGGSSIVVKRVDAVRKVVEQFAHLASTMFVYGLIDRDSGSAPAAGVERTTRYCLENYALDPFIIYCKLLDTGDVPKLPFAKDLQPGDYARVRGFSTRELQEVADSIVRAVEAYWAADSGQTLPTILTGGTEKLSVEYVTALNRTFSVALPKWLLDTPGHDLEKVVNGAFQGKVHKGALRKLQSKVRIVPRDLHTTFVKFLPTSSAVTSVQCGSQVG